MDHRWQEIVITREVGGTGMNLCVRNSLPTACAAGRGRKEGGVSGAFWRRTGSIGTMWTMPIREQMKGVSRVKIYVTDGCRRAGAAEGAIWPAFDLPYTNRRPPGVRLGPQLAEVLPAHGGGEKLYIVPEWERDNRGTFPPAPNPVADEIGALPSAPGPMPVYPAVLGRGLRPVPGRGTGCWTWGAAAAIYSHCCPVPAEPVSGGRGGTLTPRPWTWPYENAPRSTAMGRDRSRVFGRKCYCGPGLVSGNWP